MKKVTCIGYHNTGSGAVDDYLREFDCFQFAPSDLEARFLQDPDGISDLEYNLVDNWHRLNSGFAIKRFQRFARYYNHTYSLIFGPEWKKQTDQFINDLIEFSYSGYWHEDIRLQNSFSQIVYLGRRALSKLAPKDKRKTPEYNYFPRLESYYSHPDRQEFYQLTREFCEKLCKSINTSGAEYVVIDQLVSTTNINRYLNYINDLKVIIVDRDPRDIYIQHRISGEHVLPLDPVLFSKQFVGLRSSLKNELDNSNVIKIQFEDLIYHYDTTTQMINGFLGLNTENHTRKRELFNPDISVKNTQMWKNYKQFDSDMTIISELLCQYLYDFPEDSD